MKCLNTLRVEGDHRALEVTMKRRVSTYGPSTAFGQYMSLLMPYSFEFVKHQLERASKVQIIQQLDDGKSCLVHSQGRSITSTIDSCPCGFVSAMQLPCHRKTILLSRYRISAFFAPSNPLLRLIQQTVRNGLYGTVLAQVIPLYYTVRRASALDDPVQ